MGFEFGLLNSINVQTGTLCFLSIIVFIVFFEYILEFVESCREDSPAIYQMLQKIFQELMVMGLVSFVITMMQTSRFYEENENIVQAFDVTHIILFFMTISYVLHAFLLTSLSKIVAETFESYQFINLDEVIVSLRKKKNCVSEFILRSPFIPGSQLREMAEFKILEIQFRSAYRLSPTFLFSTYLTGCFEKNALNLLNVGAFIWVVVIIVGFINWLRAELMKDWSSECTHRRHEDEVNSDCNKYDLIVFFLSGVLMSIAAIVLLFITRLYEVRSVSVSNYLRIVSIMRIYMIYHYSLIHSSFEYILICVCTM